MSLYHPPPRPCGVCVRVGVSAPAVPNSGLAFVEHEREFLLCRRDEGRKEDLVEYEQIACVYVLLDENIGPMITHIAVVEDPYP